MEIPILYAIILCLSFVLPLASPVKISVTSWHSLNLLKYLKCFTCPMSSTNTLSKNKSQFVKPKVCIGTTKQPSLKQSSEQTSSLIVVTAEIITSLFLTTSSALSS